MTWLNRFKMILGIVGAIVIVAGLTVVFNQRQSQVTTATAALVAEQYPVGTDYGAVMLNRLVYDDDIVAAGDVLFILQSPSLESDISKGLVTLRTVAYSATADGILTLTASVAGTVAGVSTETGSFVQAGQLLATIERSGSLHISVDFVLTSRQFARVENAADVEITLPNQKVLDGNVDHVEVQTENGLAETTVRIRADGLVDGQYNGLVTDGTPVVARLTLRDDGPLAGVGDGFIDFLRRIGL